MNTIREMLGKALEQYGAELPGLEAWVEKRNRCWCFPRTGMYDWLEAQCLYLLIRLTRPATAREISPNYGYSTRFILQAMNQNAAGKLYSFDLTSRLSIVARWNFRRAGIECRPHEYVVGDVRHTFNRVHERHVDLLFMDSDHSYEFGRWYQRNLFPLVRRGGLIHVHDVLRFGSRPHLGDLGEGRAVWEFVQEDSISEENFLYLAELRDRLAAEDGLLRTLQAYPRSPRATNNLERCATLWLVKSWAAEREKTRDQVPDSLG